MDNQKTVLGTIRIVKYQKYLRTKISAIYAIYINDIYQDNQYKFPQWDICN